MSRPNVEEFIKVLLNEDELGLVIRVHLIVENSIEKALSQLVVNEKELEEMRLSYYQKIKLACALGVSTTFKSPLHKLGNIRNKFGHQLSYQLSKNDVDELYGTLSVKYQQKVLTTFKLNSISMNVSSYDELNVRKKFIFLAVILDYMAHRIADGKLDEDEH